MTEENPLIQVEVKQPTYKMNDTFVQISKDIPLLVERANQILSQVDENDLENTDEDDILQVIKEMKEVKPYFKQIKEARMDVKRALNNEVTRQMSLLDQQLSATGVDKLELLINKTSDLQRRIRDSRKEIRWQQLQAKFEATVAGYPLLSQYIPKQLDFNNFKQKNIKLVSASKNGHVTSNMYNIVTKFVGELESDVQSILSMNSSFQEQLFTQYQLTPNITQIIQLNHALEEKERKRLEAERIKNEKRIQEEAARIAQEQRDKDRAEQQKLIDKAQKNGENIKVIVKTVESTTGNNISKESRSQKTESPFTETLESYLNKKYPKRRNASEKWQAIFEVTLAIGHQDPDIMRFLKSANHCLDAINILQLDHQ